MNYVLEETGLYSIVVQDYLFDDSGEYKITLLKIPGAISSQGDMDGGLIASGQASGGTIDQASDIDVYQFYGEAGDRIIINVVDTSGFLNTYIDLYSPSPGSVKENSTSLSGDHMNY